ncbi:MAG: hypothetical protein ACRELV_04140 [Longimicrobiales bacterium]
MEPRRTRIGDPADTWVETYEADEGHYTTLVSRSVGGERVRIERHEDLDLDAATARHDAVVASIRAIEAKERQ